MTKRAASLLGVDAALAALAADELRKLVRNLLDELDEQARGRVISSLINHAARGNSGWTPAAVAEREIAETIAFAKAAQRVAHADPADVEDHLRRGSRAFLRKARTRLPGSLGYGLSIVVSRRYAANWSEP